MECYCGVLYVDELNFLDDGISNFLLNVLIEGVNIVEWEGVSFKYFCWFLLIVIWNFEEGEVCVYFFDCIVINFIVDLLLLFEDRVSVVEIVMDF